MTCRPRRGCAPARSTSRGRRTLEGFDPASISELARTHDLIVLDHPHLIDRLGALVRASLPNGARL
jgi:hypothetical protein